MADKKRGLTYAQVGVDIDAGNRMVELIKPLVRTTKRAGADAEIGGFGGLFDLKRCGFSDPVLVAATDGVGTKVKIAIETDRHNTIGIDLVAMSVNDLVVQGAEPLFFLDYFACGKLEPEIGAAVVAGIVLGCKEAGCALIGGETAEMPGVYQEDDYDLAGFAVGAAERNALLMQMMADVLGRDIEVPAISNATARGAAIHGAVAAGLVADYDAGAALFGAKSAKRYHPDSAAVPIYEKRYRHYLTLCQDSRIIDVLHDLAHPVTGAATDTTQVAHRVRA